MQRAYHARGMRFLPKIAIGITAGLIITALGYQTASAVDVYTDPVGFYKVTCTNNSDTLVIQPFEQIPAARGAVSSVAGNVVNAGSPGWTAGQWSTPSTPNKYYPYYMFMVSGTKAGAYYTITNNDASALSVTTTIEDLSGIASGDLYQIIPFWTLGTAFPASSVVVSTSSSAAGRRTQLLMPDLASTGISLATSAAYYYYNSAWRRSFPTSNAASNYSDVVILPDQYVTIRNATNATDTTVATTLGQVVTGPVRVPLFASAPPAAGQDTSVGINRPALQNLNQTGLSNALVASVTSSAAGRRDQVLVYDNAVQQQNKAVSATYYYYNNGWRRSFPTANAAIDYGTSNTLQTAAGFIVRKATNGVVSASTTIWVNQPNY